MMSVPPLLTLAAIALHWLPQTANSSAGLRGICAVSDKIVWATGTAGTILRTVDGGAHWENLTVPGAEKLDFRDVVAFDSKSALVMSSGNGPDSRVFRTDDGSHWTAVLTGPETVAFFDAMKFWDRRHGILLGDPIGGRFLIYTTNDGGASWQRRVGPPAQPAEGAFAASGTSLALLGQKDVWFGSGGPNVARVFHSADRAASWQTSATPMAGATPSSGVFSLLFPDPKHGIAVGGDYQKPSDPAHTLALTSDGGLTWTANTIPGGFRSGLAYSKSHHLWIAVGTNGSDYSPDNGSTWTSISRDNLNAVAAFGSSVWAVGPKGLILKLALE